MADEVGIIVIVNVFGVSPLVNDFCPPTFDDFSGLTEPKRRRVHCRRVEVVRRQHRNWGPAPLLTVDGVRITSRLAFVCVGNAGRSQMATAVAERERERRGLDLDIVTGGTDPADHVHEDVVEVMREEGIDIGDREPREITPEDIEDVDYVVTMGCSVDEFRPKGWRGESQQWELEHPGGDSIESIREQRDEIERRVIDFFNRLEEAEAHPSDR